MPSKPKKTKRAVKKPAIIERPDLLPEDREADKYMISRRFGELSALIDRNGSALDRIARALKSIDEHLVNIVEIMGSPAVKPPAPPEFVSSQWHRRSGDIYANVAEPGSPNSRDTSHGNDTAGDVRPAFKR